MESLEWVFLLSSSTTLISFFIKCIIFSLSVIAVFISLNILVYKNHFYYIVQENVNMNIEILATYMTTTKTLTHTQGGNMRFFSSLLLLLAREMNKKAVSESNNTSLHCIIQLWIIVLSLFQLKCGVNWSRKTRFFCSSSS